MTIRDYLDKGKLPNAFTTPRGKSVTWNIPLTDLVAANLLDRVTEAPRAPEPQTDTLELRLLVAQLEAENNSLRERLAETKEALARAERRVDQLLPVRAIETAAKQKQRLGFFRRNRVSEIDTMPSFRSDSE